MKRFVCHLVLGALLALVITGCEERTIAFREGKVPVVNETVGNGREVRDGDTVYIRYEVRLPDGDIVLKDNSYAFQHGRDAVIRGIDEGVAGMRIGGKRTIKCPPEKHWGRTGYGGKIPPNTTLMIDIEVLRID